MRGGPLGDVRLLRDADRLERRCPRVPRAPVADGRRRRASCAASTGWSPAWRPTARRRYRKVLTRDPRGDRRRGGARGAAGRGLGARRFAPVVAAVPRGARRAHRAPRTRMEARRSCRTPTPTTSQRRSRSIGVPIDVTVTASEIGSYKPAFAHWETFFRRTGADRARHVHVAASLFHDVRALRDARAPVRVDQPARRDVRAAARRRAARPALAARLARRARARPRLGA